MPASVNVVFNTLKDLVNKDQQGFVTVDEFNRFAQVAQLRIFNRLFDSLKEGSRLERAGFGQGRDKSKFKQINEDLATFAKTDKNVPKENGVFVRPSSTLNAPTKSYPVALVSGDIEVFPESINKIQMRYYKVPQSFTTNATPARSDNPPFYGTTSGEAFDSATSFDFEMPEHYTMDLVMEIAQLIGVNLRDDQVGAFSQREQMERKTEQTF